MGYIEDEIDRLRLRCIGCGKCSRVCPSLKHGGCDPMEMMIGGDEGIEHCIACGNCSKACRRTDPFTVMRDLLALRNGLHVSDAFKTTGYAMPIKPVEGCPEPEWTGDDVMVMPGCVVRCKVPYVEYAMSVALKAMGLKGTELPNNTCCMHPAQFREMTEMERRNVKKSMEGNASGKGIVTLCGGCSEELQDAGIDAQHIIPFLHANIDRLPRTSEPLKVALQPGCSAMPFKKQMAEVVEAMGYENINNQMGCCGKNTDVAGPLMAERMEECAKADVIVVGCPMCLVKYDALPEGKPVVHISELVAMASGDKRSLGYHTVPIL